MRGIDTLLVVIDTSNSMREEKTSNISKGALLVLDRLLSLKPRELVIWNANGSIIYSTNKNAVLSSESLESSPISIHDIPNALLEYEFRSNACPSIAIGAAADYLERTEYSHGQALLAILGDEILEEESTVREKLNEFKTVINQTPKSANVYVFERMPTGDMARDMKSSFLSKSLKKYRKLLLEFCEETDGAYEIFYPYTFESNIHNQSVHTTPASAPR
ncbi:hypothetical protein VDG1235_1834 [Verrucomicrobiia bacterium DG1235]|nr:hypothetical protein VDG1235_1834 [Verrucomicrobiae bacterium DG1235]